MSSIVYLEFLRILVLIACSGRIQQFESFAGFTLSTEIDFQSMEGILEPVEVGSLSLYMYLQGFYTSQVVQDFFHQQYFPKLNVRRPEVGQLAAGEVVHVLEAWAAAWPPFGPFDREF